MSNEYEYDSSGLSSSLLALSISIPILLISIPFVFGSQREKVFRCDCVSCKGIEGVKRGCKAKKPLYARYIFVLALVLLLIPLKIAVFDKYEQEGGFNPYEILGVSRMATKKEIKKAFRKQARQTQLAQKNKQNTGDRLQKLVLAEKTLTNDKLRETWESFGDTHGKKTQTIAIPHWAVSSKNSWFLFLFYISAFGVFLPLLASQHWKKTSTSSRFGVSYSTVELFYREIKKFARKNTPSEMSPTMFRHFVQLISTSPEFTGRKWKTDPANLPKLRDIIEEQYAIPFGQECDFAKSGSPERVSPFAYTLVLFSLVRLIADAKAREKVSMEDLRHVQDVTIMALSTIRRIARAVDNKNYLFAAIAFERCFVQSAPSPRFWLMQYPGEEYLALFAQEPPKAAKPSEAAEDRPCAKQRLYIEESMFRFSVLSLDLYVPGRGLLGGKDAVEVGDDVIIKLLLSREGEGGAAKKEEPPAVLEEREEEDSDSASLENINFGDTNEYEPDALNYEDVYIKAGDASAVALHAPFLITPQKYRWTAYLIMNEHVVMEAKEFSSFANGQLQIFFRVSLDNKLIGLIGKGQTTVSVSLANSTFFDRDVSVKRILLIK